MKHLFSLGRSAAALLLLAAASVAAQAQTTPGVGIGTTAPDASAALDIVSSSKGLLLPRLTAAQRGAIAAPVPAGLLVYQTDGLQPGFWYYEATAGWTPLGAGDHLGNHLATQALHLQSQALTGTGASIGGVGVGVRADGGLNLGQHGVGNNLLLGYQAGQSLTPSVDDGAGLFNQFSGYQSGQATTIGSVNLFGGYQSGYSNTTGSGNQFLGFQSGYSNTTGEANVFSGYHSGYSNTTGFANHFDGVRSGFANTTGYNNQYLGNNAGAQSISGSHNLFVGYGSGLFNETGSNLTALGANSGPDFTKPDLENATALGANTKVTQSNTVVLGNGASVGIGTTEPAEKLQVNGTIFSSTGGFRFPDGTVQTTAAAADHLGNHTATQALDLGPNALVGNGGTTGLSVTSAGDARLPAANAYTYAAAKTYNITYGISDVQLEQHQQNYTMYRVDTGSGEFVYANQAMRIPVHLPQGATIMGIKCYGRDTDGSNDLRVFFLSVLPTDTSMGTPGSYSDTAASSGTPGYSVLFFTPASSHIIDNNRAYYLLVNAASADCAFGAVRVTYTVTQAE